MASLPYHNYEGAGQKWSDSCHYSQAVVLGNTVKCAGQGGWELSGELDADNIQKQVELAMANVDRVLQTVGLRGWDDVYLLRSYHVDMDASFNLVVEALRKRIPGHKPVWTSVQVGRLAVPAMKIELEVEALKRD